MPEKAKKAIGKDIKIGELLVTVGVVTSGDLQEAIQIAKRMTLPIGRVIVMSGVVTEVNLQFALEAQSLVRDGFIDLDTACLALKNAYNKGMTLQEALADLRWHPKKDVVSNKLGEILIDSNLITQAQLDSALKSSFETGMPLGGTLVRQGVLNAQLLPAVLSAQEQIRDGKLTRADAVENLKAALLFWAKADDSETGETGSTAAPAPKPAVLSSAIGLVDMMKMAGYCNDQEIQAAIDQALSNSNIASKLFMATGLLSKTSFDNFVRCRALIVRGALRPEQAIYALSACRIRTVALDEVFNEMGVKISEP